MLNFLNKILAILPFNGKKTGIGVVLSALAYFFPDFPLGEAQIDEVIKSALKIFEYGGNIYLVLGVLHKYIKAKL
jgi:hypothetical protein